MDEKREDKDDGEGGRGERVTAGSRGDEVAAEGVYRSWWW